MGSQNWETPKHLFYYWNAKYHFTIDAAASRENALLPRYWTIEDDGLTQDWTGERVFFNPPYASNVLHKWVRKAAERKAELAFGLLPANTDTRWFHDYIYKSPDVELGFILGRIHFFDPEQPGIDRPRYPNMIVIWRSHA